MPSKKSIQQRNILIGVVAVALAGIVAWGFLTDWKFGSLQTVGFQAPANSISTKVVAKNNASWDIDDSIQRTWYKCDISEMDAEDIKALTIADFEVMSTSKAEIDYDAKYAYVLKVNGSHQGVTFQTMYFTTNSLIGDGKMQILKVGELNVIELYEVPKTYSMLAYPTHMPNATTVNGTQYADWTIKLFTIDSKNNVSTKAGFERSYNFETGKYSCTILTFTFNTTVSTSDVKITTGYDYVKITSSTTVVQLIINCDYVTGNDFTIRLSSGLRTTYDLVTIAAGIGYEGSVTNYITQ